MQVGAGLLLSWPWALTVKVLPTIQPWKGASVFWYSSCTTCKGRMVPARLLLAAW
jgi:hypothetical protein